MEQRGLIQDGARSESLHSRDHEAAPADSSPASRADIKGLQAFITAELERTTRTLSAEIQAVGERTAHLEEQAGRIVEYCNDLAGHAETMEQRVQWLEESMEDLSNRSRRNNVRLQGLPESVTPDELQDTFLGIVKRLIPDVPPQRLLLDRIHRALGPRRDKTTTPRDVIARFHYYNTKDSLLKAARTQEAK
uniref:L1 transposable element RRM domain-containing protein n=1 Tax=Leptobrachium leishanense TaxID=445787 RepID=A0A8C5R2X7_9ANUR